MGGADDANSGDGQKILYLVRTAPRADKDTVQLLERLLAEAKCGKLTGLIAVTFRAPECRGREFDLSYAGTAARNPLLGLGAMDVCQMLLRENALSEDGAV